MESIIKNNSDEKILVFVRTKVRAERVMKAMERVGLMSDTIHSDRLQEKREEIMRNFRKGDLKVLIATDVSARGIDIPNVEFVINYDLPESLENYVHRVGRTGRGTEKGQAISFCSEEEKDQLQIIEEKLGKEIQRIDITKKEYKNTLEVSGSNENDWQALLDEDEKQQREGYGKKKKRKPKY